MIPSPDNTPGNPLATEPSAPSKLWKTQQVADFLGVSPKSVFNLRKKGLPCVHLGGAVRFVPHEISGYLATNRSLSLHRLRQIARKGGSA
jgi:predicted DNA-binding transcriptional regulator AlpA